MLIQEIETLKSQLKEAHEKLAAGPVTTGKDLIDLSTATTTAADAGDTDGVTEVERKLKAEQSARQDMEMHVTTLNSQRGMCVSIVVCTCVLPCVCACVYALVLSGVGI